MFEHIETGTQTFKKKRRIWKYFLTWSCRGLYIHLHTLHFYPQHTVCQ